MTSGLNLWDSEVWSLILTLGLLFGMMLLANTLRRLCGFLQRLMIPSSVLGGFLLLGINSLLKAYCHFSLYSTATLEILTYHGLGLGFAALSLRRLRKDQDGRSRTGALDAGITVVNGYLLQAVLGLAITIGLYYLIGSFYGSGVLLPDRPSTGVTTLRSAPSPRPLRAALPTAPASVWPWRPWALCPPASAAFSI